jgi:hypothetical protein
MSVGKTSDDCMVLVFTKEDVNVFKEKESSYHAKGNQSSSASEITRDNIEYH